MSTQPQTMKIRCVAFMRGQQWVAVCLPFSLCAQADTLEEAKLKLHLQMESYVSEAYGIDSAHRARLLKRPAPWLYWFYYGIAAVLKAFKSRHSRYNNFHDSVAAVPMAC